MLRLLLLLALAPLAGCASDSDAPAAAHDPAADRLLVHVRGDAWDALFAASPEAQFTHSASGDPERQVTHDSVPNPLPAFLSDEPPFLDAAARDQYVTRIIGDTTLAGRSARVVEARFVSDGRRTQPVRLVRASVDPATGDLLSVDVSRDFESALYKERSRLRASVAAGGAALILDHAIVETSTNVPLSSPRNDRVVWTLTR